MLSNIVFAGRIERVAAVPVQNGVTILRSPSESESGREGRLRLRCRSFTIWTINNPTGGFRGFLLCLKF